MHAINDRARNFLLKLVAVALVVAPRPSLAQTDVRACVDDRGKIPVAVTLSGGVSLGAFQAGFLYYTGLAFRENSSLFDTKIFTGASAGGLNTLLSILSFCGSEPARPTQSALWRAWVNLRAEDLARGIDDPRALLSRRAFLDVAEDIRKQWNAGLPEACDVVLGVSATRVVPARVHALGVLEFERQEEKFTLRVQGRGVGRPPMVTNYVNASSGHGQPLLDLKPGDGRQNFDALRDLLLATAAFPTVFPPQKLRYCVIDSTKPRWLHADYPLACQAGEIEEAEFIDGGILDNKPLGLAQRIVQSGLRTNACSAARWAQIPAPAANEETKDESTLFIYADLGALAFPRTPTESGAKAMLSFAGSFFQGLYDSSRNRDTLATLEQNPRFARQIVATHGLFPRAGDHMIGFSGFFERDFRAYDFYLGMYEAREFLRSRIMPYLPRGSRESAGVSLPERSRLGEQDWRPLACLISVFENGTENGCESFAPADAKNFKTLAHLSMERLRVACSENQAEAGRPGSSCARLQNRIKPVSPEEQSSRHSGESDFAFSLRYLAENRFEFRDLGLKPDEAASAGAKIKSGALGAMSELAAAQPPGDGLFVRAGGPVVLNLIERLPTESDAFVVTGLATRFGISLLDSGPSRRGLYPPRGRLVFAAQLENLAAWIGSGHGGVVPTGLGGVEWEVGDINSAILQTRLGLLAGYKFNGNIVAADGNDLNACERNRRSPAECRGFVIQPTLSFTFLERLRLETNVEFLPAMKGAMPWQILPAAGLQFYF
jgi:predicted acylesterase/phospholipase RssA